MIVSTITLGRLTGGRADAPQSGGRDEPRPAQRPRRLVPRAREGRRAHARRVRARLRGRPPALRRAARADRGPPPPGPALPPAAGVPAARAGAAGLGRRPPLQRRLPRG